MCDLCAKGFFNYEFNSADIDKISNFNEIASNFTYLCTSKFIKYNLTDTDHLLLKSKFYGKGKSGMYFCIFGSCQPLTSLNLLISPVSESDALYPAFKCIKPANTLIFGPSESGPLCPPPVTPLHIPVNINNHYHGNTHNFASSASLNSFSLSTCCRPPALRSSSNACSLSECLVSLLGSAKNSNTCSTNRFE